MQKGRVNITVPIITNMQKITMNIPDAFMPEIEEFTQKGFAKEDVYAITIIGVILAARDQSLIAKYMKDPECKKIITDLVMAGLSEP